MEIRVLGPVEVERGGRRVRLGGPKQRAVLSLLALNANVTVSVDRLIEGLWGERQPASAAKMVQLYVSQLRRLLAEEGGTEIVTHGRGYELRVDPEAVDAARFERLVGEASRSHRNGGAGEAAHRALALWRGPPLADLVDEPFAPAEARRLEELHLTALELAIEGDLEAGRHRELIGRLESLVAEHPLRERLHGLRMLALYRAGRQAEALEAYRAARATLVEEIGAEPGPELRRLQEQILRQDPALELAPRELPAELTRGSPALAGRGAELERLRAAWREARDVCGRVVLVTGVRGIGKTRLIGELAGELHTHGATVVYVGGTAPAGDAAAALERARRATGPGLLVFDDLDRASDLIVSGAAELAAGARERSLLVVLAYRDHRPSPAVGRLAREVEARGAERLALRPLGADGVREIAALYAGERAASAPVERLLEASGGLPRRIHEVVADWTRRETVGRVGARAARAAARRGELRELEAELASNVVDLDTLRERAEGYAPAPRPQAPDGGDAGAIAVCPFKGLACYDVADADYFFGRERLVAEIVARLVGASLLGVVGPSGSGKSSAVRAGLLPALARGVLPGSERWRCLLLRPGEHPLVELRRALGAPDDTDDAIAGALARVEPPARLVLCVDQFEETFAACRDETERGAFIDALADAAQRHDGRVLVVLALRADYYGACAAHPRLSRLLDASQVLVGPMRRDELARAIDGPARKAGLVVEPELVTRLVDDAAGQPGGLPLLSTALLELWQRRDGRRMRLAHYEQSRGVHGAVARLAERAYGTLTHDEQRLARRILLRLAGAGEGGAVVRRRVPLDELEADRDQQAARVLEVLTASRLVTLGERTAEVAHEALLREWPRLRGWLEEDAEGRRLQRHITLAARDWDSGGRDPGELYRGARLSAALEWSATHEPDLNATERAFLRESRAASERSQRRLRATLAGVAALLVLAVIAGAVALEQRGAAREEAIAAEAQRLGARALVDKGLDRALLLARQGVALHDSVQTRGNLLAALVRSPAAIGVLRGAGERMWTIELSPDEHTLAAGDPSGNVLLFDTRTRRRLATIEPTSGDWWIVELAFSPDGRRLAIAHDGPRGNVVSILDTRSHRIVQRLTPPRERIVWPLRYSADGRQLDVVAAPRPGEEVAPATLTRFDVRSGRRLLGPVPLNSSGSSPLLATSDRRRLVTAGPGEVTVRDATTLRRLKRLRAPKAAVASAYALGPDDRTVAIGDQDGSVRLLDLRTGGSRTASDRHAAAVTAARFSPDGRSLVTTGDDRDVIVWDVRAARPRETLSGHASGVTAAEITRDGKTLYTASLDGTVFIWDLDGARRLGRPFTAGAGGRPWFSQSSDGRLIATAQGDGAIAIVDAHTLEPRATFPVVDSGAVGSIGFVPGSHLVVVGGEPGDGFLALVDADTGRIIRRLRGHRGSINVPGISADGRLLTTSDQRHRSGTVRFWSLPDGRAQGVLRFDHEIFNSQLSPDGRRLTICLCDPDLGGGEVQVWDTRSRQRLRSLHIAGVTRFSPDGRLLAVGNRFGRARVFSTQTWKPVTRFLVGDPSGILAAVISRDGRTLATGSDTGTVRLWDIPTQQAVGALPGEPSRAAVPHFTRDGTHLIASYDNGRAYLWDLRPERLLRQACQVAGRRLTREEWAEFLPDRDYDPAC
jgi:WD40 repeat protein/DNA-binding SARP family transcriptional activator